MIKVRALRQGYYGSLREAGEEFNVMKKADVGTWMVEVDKLPGRGGKQGGEQDADDIL